MKKRFLTLFFAPTLSLLGASSALAGPYDTWSNFRYVTVNTTTAAVTGTVVNFPLLVRLTNADAAHGSDILATSSTGADLRFTDSAGTTALSYQIDTWSAASAAIWIKVPSIAGSATTTLRMYWGKSGQISASDGGAVFDTANGFRSAWHMGDAAGVSPRPNAVTPYSSLTATPAGFSAWGYTPGVTGLIGGGDPLVGGIQGTFANGALTSTSAPYFTVDSGTATTAYNFPGGAFTGSLWAKLKAVNRTTRFFNLQGSVPGAAYAEPTNAVQIIPVSAAVRGRYNTSVTTYNNVTNAPTFANTAGTWHHFSLVVNRGAADTMKTYADGVLLQTVSSATVLLPDTLRNYLFFGRAFGSASDSVFAGVFDEITFANASRSADWIKLSYATQSAAQTAVALGTTQVTATVPGAPTTVAGTAGNAQVAVSWNAPSSDGGAAITAYTVSSTPTSAGCTTTGSLTCTVTGLTNGTGYTFTVTATNAAGTGAASAASATVTPVAPPGAPDVPTIGTATAGNGQATVNWTAATTGTAATGFIATSSPDGKTCTTTVAVTCVITGLTNGTAYTLKVVATNSAGSSQASAASNSVTPVGIPDAPAAPTAAAGNAQAVITWTAPASNGGATITSYKAMAVADTTKSCSTTGALTCTLTGLTNGTAYTFVVKAGNSAGVGAASAASVAVTPATVPGAPTGVTLVATPGLPPSGLGSIAASWTAPASNGGSAITGYTATFSPGAATCTSTGALTCTLSNLTTTSGYTATVTATNAVGTGGASAASAPTAIHGAISKQGFGLQKNGSTMVFFFPKTSKNLRVSVMDSKGRPVWSKTVDADITRLSWNGRTEQGSVLHGIYLARFTVGENGKSTVVAENKILIMP